MTAANPKNDEPTLSGPAPKETAETAETTLPTTNAEFLAAVFEGLDTAAERPMLVPIRGTINARTKWPTGYGWTPKVVTDDDALNWYFTLSTYRPADGKFRRTKAQFARAFGVYCDDVGTKAAPVERLAACPPSYLIETSTGNFHAGYLFDEPCADLARVEALQNAFAAAGLCDPGAKGPSSRVGRLPFAVNGKYSPPHRCRLAEFHPGRRYSIDQIVDLLDLGAVAPTPAPGQRRKAEKTRRKAEAVDRAAEADVYRPRPAENAVLAALRQRGLYKAPLGGGRHDVTCPWVHEHTGAVDHGTAYFEPDDLYPVGGFKCQHSHGEGKRMGALLEFLGLSFAQAKHKPTICVTPGELHRVVDAAERELALAGRFYQRGGLIATVRTDPASGATAITALNVNALTFALSSVATWERWDARSEAYVATDPPPRHVNVLAEAPMYMHLPVLRGIARQPFLRENGTLATRSGYDADSGMFGTFDERQFKVKTAPTPQDAQAALAGLRELLAEFRFAAPADEAAALGLVLTAAIRPALPVAPMGHFKAPLRSSGKSYLQTLVAAFAGPSSASAYAFPSTEDECSKLLLAALAEAPASICFDNLTGDLIPFKTLCSALTEPSITGRLLGFSKVATVPTATVILSSGNNVDAIKDMARRVVTVNLDPQCERPESIEYRGSPVDALRRDRGRFVSMALTIVRAYLQAGCPALPVKLKAIGSYGEWTRLVRAPLVWLGLPDPAATMFASLEVDPERELVGRTLAAWRRAFGSTPTAVREAVARAEGVPFGPAADTELAEVLRELVEDRGQINRKKLGRWLARHAGRIVDGMRFVRSPRTTAGERWAVVVNVVSAVSAVSPGAGAESVRPQFSGSANGAPAEEDLATGADADAEVI